MSVNNTSPAAPDGTQPQPKPQDLNSKTIASLPPLRPNPKLRYFSYLGEKFTSPAPKPPTNDLERTKYIVEQLLVGGKSDIALAFLRDNNVRPPEVLTCHPANTTRLSDVCSRPATFWRAPGLLRPSGRS